jgi:hypothetical protein
MNLRICKACKRTFVPQLSDDQLLALFYEPEYVEKVEFLQAEYPGFMGVPSLNTPKQIVCTKCMDDPNVEITTSWMGGVEVRRKNKK